MATKKTAPKKRTFIRKTEKEKSKKTVTSYSKAKREIKVKPEESVEQPRSSEETPYELHVHEDQPIPQDSTVPQAASTLEVTDLGINATAEQTQNPQTSQTPVSQSSSTAEPQPAVVNPEQSGEQAPSANSISSSENPSVDQVSAPSSTEPTTPAVEEQTVSVEKGKSNLPKILLFIIVVLLLIGIIFIFVSLNSKSNTKQKTITVVTSPTKVPSPTTMPVPAASTYPIVVLNGSGISGEASRVKKLLTDAEYSVASVGNASSSAYKATVVQAKTDVSKEWVSELRTFLLKSYETVTVEKLEASASSKVVVILGNIKK